MQLKTYLMDVFCNKNDVTNANTQLIYNKESVSDQNSRGSNPTDTIWPLFKCEFHTLGIRQKRSSMLFTQDVLRSHKNVETVGANKADKRHIDESTEPATVVKRLVHRQDSRSQTSFQQMRECFGVAGKFLV